MFSSLAPPPKKKKTSIKKKRKPVAKKAIRTPQTTQSQTMSSAEAALNIYTHTLGVSKTFHDYQNHSQRYQANDTFKFQSSQILSNRSNAALAISPELQTSGRKVPSKDTLFSYMHTGFEDDQGLFPIHKACANFADNAKFIGMMIRKYPDCASMPVSLPQDSVHRKRKSVCPAPSNTALQESSVVIEDGQYPIHIALSNNASIEVIKVLIRAAPEALSKPDCNGLLPISLALRFYKSATDVDTMNSILRLLLISHPYSAFSKDKRMNTPLHYACLTSTGRRSFRRRTGVGSTALSDPPQTKEICSLFMKQLAFSNPAAMYERNFNGFTPLDLAQSRGEMSDKMISFLQKLTFGGHVIEVLH